MQVRLGAIFAWLWARSRFRRGGQVRGEFMGATAYDEPSTPGRVLDRASASCQRDVTPSFRNTFRRW